MDLHYMYKFSGISIDNLNHLDIYEYRFILINTIYEQALKTKEGREMLKTFDMVQNPRKDMDISGLERLLSM